MSTFTEKELDILYLALSRLVAKGKDAIQKTDKEKNPVAYARESQILKEWQDLQEKLDDVIFSQNKFPEIID